MNLRAYNPSPVLRRPEYFANTTSTRLFNHSYPPKQQVYNQPSFQPTYPTMYQTSYPPAYQPSRPSLNYNYNYNYPYPLPQSQSLVPSATTSNYSQITPTVFNSPLLSGSGIYSSSKGLETILIAILVLVALDLIVIRPNKAP